MSEGIDSAPSLGKRKQYTTINSSFISLVGQGHAIVQSFGQDSNGEEDDGKVVAADSDLRSNQCYLTVVQENSVSAAIFFILVDKISISS